MATTGPTFDVSADYTDSLNTRDLSSSPFWIVAVVQLGTPLTFSRLTMSSISTDLTVGALTRNRKPLVITDDCIQMQVDNNKANPVKSMTASFKHSTRNYLVDILPGDWVLSWMMTNEEDYLKVLAKIDAGEPCNEFGDGFKFLGRVHSIRSALSMNRGTGTKTVTYNIQCSGFNELNSMFFYDRALVGSDFSESKIGTWLTRIGIDINEIFGTGNYQGNINLILQRLLDLIVGRGVAKTVNPAVNVGLSAGTGAGATEEAPFAYLVPEMVGNLIGKKSSDASKAGGILAYADILELIQGVQKYESPSEFVPKVTKSLTGNRYYTDKDLLGSFIPLETSYTNRPLWSILQQYVNPTVNELFTSLRVSPTGLVTPTLVFRQIPFTTEAFDDVELSHIDEIPNTRFLNLPRWVIPSHMIFDANIGRSDGTRVNFVHLYGTASAAGSAFSMTSQLAQNPPIRDDLDIQRSGLRTYVATTEVAPVDQVFHVPGKIMALVSDWMIGSQYTLNGTIECLGIQSPIAEGDNIQWDGVVYHIESVSQSVGINPVQGNKFFTTKLTVTNGMRQDGATDVQSADDGMLPIYPGFKPTDNTANYPGFSVDRKKV